MEQHHRYNNTFMRAPGSADVVAAPQSVDTVIAQRTPRPVTTMAETKAIIAAKMIVPSRQVVRGRTLRRDVIIISL